MYPKWHQILNIFKHSASIIRWPWMLLKYPCSNFKKMVCSKNFWTQHWQYFCMELIKSKSLSTINLFIVSLRYICFYNYSPWGMYLHLCWHHHELNSKNKLNWYITVSCLGKNHLKKNTLPVVYRSCNS